MNLFQKNLHVQASLSISGFIEIVAGFIDSSVDYNKNEQTKHIYQSTTIHIYGTLKKTVFATSFQELLKLINLIKDNPDEYISETPQSRVFFSEFNYEVEYDLKIF